MGTICRQKTCERSTFAVKMMVFKRVRGWTFSMRTVPIQNFVEYPPGKKSLCIETTHTAKRCLLTSVWQHFFTFRYISILSNIFWSTAGKCWDFRNSRHHGTMEGRVLPSNGFLQFQGPKNTFQQLFYNAVLWRKAIAFCDCCYSHTICACPFRMQYHIASASIQSDYPVRKIMIKNEHES